MGTGNLPEEALIIFAGSADIDVANMEQLLQEYMPEAMAPVIQDRIPPRYKGLRKVSDWLGEQFKSSQIKTPASILEYINSLKDTDDTYLVVLWGDGGGDKPTEQIIDAAAGKGIQVLDLADGLDELKLDDTPPAPVTKAPAAARQARRQAPAKDAGKADEKPPWDDDDMQPGAVTGAADLTDICITMLEGALRALRDSKNSPVADVAHIADHRRQPSSPGAPTLWYQDPADPDHYVFRKRGRRPEAQKGWAEVELTGEQVRQLGLIVPESREQRN